MYLWKRFGNESLHTIMSKNVLLSLLMLVPIIIFGQTPETGYHRLAKLHKIAKQKGGIVVSCYPMTAKLDAWILSRVKKQRRDSILTDSVAYQIIEATKNWDTTKWESTEFNGKAVITERSERLNAKKLLDGWGICDKETRKVYRRQINTWVNTEVDNRPIWYISRPVLTKDGKFGLVAWDLVSNGLCCGGQVVLYKYESGNWIDLGTIYRWAH